MLRASGRVIMVSGPSRGLGLAIAKRLHETGFTVAAGARNPAAVAVKTGLSADRYDAEETGSAEAWVQAVATRYGRIDGLVNCAGINLKVRVMDPGEENLDQMWRINVKPLRVTRAAVPHLLKPGEGHQCRLTGRTPRRVECRLCDDKIRRRRPYPRYPSGIVGQRRARDRPGYIATDMTSGETEVSREDMTQPDDLAEMVETLLRLRNNLSVAELLVNCRKESML